MNEDLVVDLFVEDRAHEEFVSAIVRRIAEERQRHLHLRVRAARGGYPRVLKELSLYQAVALKNVVAMPMPDVLVVAADANCQGVSRRKRALRRAIKEEFAVPVVLAVPDPHVERWYLSDRQAFREVVGAEPRAGRRKCERELYKRRLAQAVRDAGHPVTLGGIEFARELVQRMDFFRVGRTEPSFRQFVSDAESAFTRAGS